MNDISKLLSAVRFAAIKHSGQYRKGPSPVPYINHPIEVAALLSEIGLIDDIDILSAALLHDTIEDTETTADELAQLFGKTVADYVVELTDDMSLPKEERRRLQVEHAPMLSPGAKVIKLADKISNIRDVLENPSIDWDADRKLDYIQWGINVVDGLRGTNMRLESYFDELVKRSESELSFDLKG